MPISVEKTTTLYTDGTAQQTHSANTFGSAPAVGSRIIVFVAWWHSGGTFNTAPTISDNYSNTYSIDKVQRGGATATGNQGALIASAPVTSSGSGLQVSVDYGSGNTFTPNIQCIEVSGLASSSTLDQTGSTYYGASPSDGDGIAVSTDGATDTADELVVALLAVAGGDAVGPNITVPPSTGFTSIGLNDDYFNVIGYNGAYKTVSSTGTQSATWTYVDASSGVAKVIATYRMASAGGAKNLLLLGVG